jgi:hypothetical protein
MLILSKPVVAWTLLAASGLGSVAGATVVATVNTTGADLIVVSGSGHTAFPTGVLSDSHGNTWTTIGGGPSLGSAWMYYYMFYCHKPTVGPGHTFTWQSPGSTVYGALSILAFSGSNASDPVLDQHTFAAAGVGTSFQSGAITPTQGNELIVAACGQTCNVDQTLTTWAVSAPFVLRTNLPNTSGQYLGGATASLIQVSAASVNPTWSWTPAADSQAVAIIASFKGS